jgi:alkylation response protein AidB-like acyl-CoA dehydrogenase
VSEEGDVMDTIDVEAFRAQARAWLEENLERREPARHQRARGMETKTVDEIVPERALQRRLYEAGYAGIAYPVEYGGRGLSTAHETAFREEAKFFAMPAFGVAGGTTFDICLPTLLVHASPAFLRRHVPAMLRGDELWVELFSEPAAGSDLAGIRTTATRDGDQWSLNGSKIWSSGAYYADWGMCLARTDWNAPKHRGLTWFAVPLRAKGVTVTPIKEIHGDIEFCEEQFDDVPLSDDDVIGHVNEGWSVTQTMLVFERKGAGGSAPSAATDVAPDLVALARRAGREADPIVRQQIARAHVNDVVHGLLNRRVASLIAATAAAGPALASYSKLAAGTLKPIRARIALEIGGPEALTYPDGDADAMVPAVNYLTGRTMAIAGGTNETQRNAIGERVLGLPREPSFDASKPFVDVVRDAATWNGRVS